MGNVSFTIDTSDMASSVDVVSRQLEYTAGAVASMSAAVVKSEKEAADTICKNVDRGFFTLMQSQISAKKAKYYSELTSKMALLMELARSLDTKEDRMESDVARLHRQYYKTFHSIDRALDHRIRQLDHDAMVIADSREELITGRQLKDVGAMFFSEQEIHNTAQLSFMARIKAKTSRALSHMTNDVLENRDYNKQVSEVLEETPAATSDLEYIPVLYVSQDSMVAEDSSVIQVYIPETMDPTAKAEIENSIRNYYPVLPKNIRNDYETSEIHREFQNMVESADVSTRVSQMMLRLFEGGSC